MGQECVFEDIEVELIDSIHKFVEEYLDSFDRQLSEVEQAAAILIAYDKLIKKCSVNEEPIEKKIIAEHFGDKLIRKMEKKKLDQEVKNVYIKGL